MHSFAEVTLRTTRLLLHPLGETDADVLFDIFSDPLVMRYWSSPAWTSVRQASEIIERDRIEMTAGEHLRLGITIAEKKLLIGTCSLFNINEQCRRAEMGYGLAASAWGKGYMTEALEALLHYAFKSMHFNRIEADIDPRNEASAKILLRLGFRKEGYLRERWIVNGDVSDSELYGLLRKEWEERESTS
jgi:RimJ/RimL family protein N-acetyltransferase